MNNIYLILAVPVFLGIILGEHLYGKSQGERFYESRDTWANLACGIGQGTLDLFFTFPILKAYQWISAHWAFASWRPGAGTFVAAFLTVDFIEYWFHRISHRVSFMWAIHAVHHQSEEYNFSVGLRQAWFHKFTAFPIYLLPAFLGYPFETYIFAASLHAAAQIWVHTRMIPAGSGWIRRVFVLPSHHRVHHAVNPQYIDRNFAGILSVWDYLFGTFTPEEEAPRYGISRRLMSWNALEANTRGWSELSRLARSKRGLSAKIRVYLQPPEVTARELADLEASPSKTVSIEFERARPAWPEAAFLMAAFVAFESIYPRISVYAALGGALVLMAGISYLGIRVPRRAE